MKLTLTFLLFFTFLAFIGFSQDKILELETKLKTYTADDTNRAKVLHLLAWELRSNDLEQARKYELESLEISKKTNFQIGISDAYNGLGIFAKNEQDFEEALKYYQKSIAKATEISYPYGIARAGYQIGNLNKILGNYDRALKSFHTSFNSFQVIGNQKLAALSLDNIGTIYRDFGKLDTALIYHNRALEIRKTLENVDVAQYEQARSYQTIGMLYQEMGNYNLSNEMTFKALAIFEVYEQKKNIAQCFNNIGNNYYYLNNYEKAKDNYLKAITLKSSIGAISSLGLTYMNLGEISMNENQTVQAKKYFQKAIPIFKTREQLKELTFLNLKLGDLAIIKNEPNVAIQYLNEALITVDSIDNLILKMNTLKSLSTAHELANEPKLALEYLQKHDSLQFELETSYKAAIELKIQNDEKEKELELLKSDKALQTSKYQRRLLTVLLLGVILIILFITMILRSRQIVMENKNQLQEQELQLKDKEIDNLLQDAELKSTYAKLEGRDQERNRVAKDLHDRLGSMLATVKLYFKSIDEKLENLQFDKQQQYNKANELLDEACEEVRRIAKDMQSSVLVKFGLIAQLNKMSQTIETSQQLKMSVHSFNFNERIDSQLEIKIYRIIQELVSNVLKHAQANQININITRDENELNIIVEDDGRGFDTNQDYEGMGLKNVSARVNDLAGSISFDSGQGAGTTVIIDLKI